MMEFFPQPHFHIDAIALEDVDALAAIHATGFLRGWSAEEFEALVVDDMVTGLALRRQSFLGARRIVGFVLFRTVAGQAEILSIAVEPGQRGRGHGRRLMEEALRHLYIDRVPELFLEVDESNLAAVTLYRKLGFIEVGKRKGYYASETGVAGTALVMKLELQFARNHRN